MNDTEADGMSYARELAAQCWCDPETSGIEMDSRLAEAFARRLALILDQLERERTRLAACGVVAMSDTTESADRVRDMHDDYRSASCDAVARRVDECIANRARIVEQDAEIMRLRIELDNIAARRIA